MNPCPPSPSPSLATRLQAHQALAAQLAGLDDAALSRWLATAPPALALCEFSRRLQRDSKLSPYPAIALRRRP